MPQTLREATRGCTVSQSTVIIDHGGGIMLLTEKLRNPKAGRVAF